MSGRRNQPQPTRLRGVYLSPYPTDRLKNAKIRERLSLIFRDGGEFLGTALEMAIKENA